LPHPFLIIEPAKIAEMLYIASHGPCGEDDLSLLQQMEIGTSGPSGRNYSGQKVKICSE
jgi:hypothetical protein